MQVTLEGIPLPDTKRGRPTCSRSSRWSLHDDDGVFLLRLGDTWSDGGRIGEDWLNLSTGADCSWNLQNDPGVNERPSGAIITWEDHPEYLFLADSYQVPAIHAIDRLRGALQSLAPHLEGQVVGRLLALQQANRALFETEQRGLWRMTARIGHPPWSRSDNDFAHGLAHGTCHADWTLHHEELDQSVTVHSHVPRGLSIQGVLRSLYYSPLYQGKVPRWWEGTLLSCPEQAFRLIEEAWLRHPPRCRHPSTPT